MKKNCLARPWPSKENSSKMHDFGRFWCIPGWFGDILEWFGIAKSHCVLTRLNRVSKITSEYLVRLCLLGCYSVGAPIDSHFSQYKFGRRFARVAFLSCSSAKTTCWFHLKTWQSSLMASTTYRPTGWPFQLWFFFLMVKILWKKETDQKWI